MKITKFLKIKFVKTAQGTTFAASGIIVNCPIVAFASS